MMGPLDLALYVRAWKRHKLLIVAASAAALVMGAALGPLTVPGVYESGVLMRVHLTQPSAESTQDSSVFSAAAEVVAWRLTPSNFIAAYLIRLQDPALARTAAAAAGFPSDWPPDDGLPGLVRLQPTPPDDNIMLVASGHTRQQAEALAAFLAQDFQSFARSYIEEQFMAELIAEMGQSDRRMKQIERNIATLEQMVERTSPFLRLPRRGGGPMFDGTSTEFLPNPAYTAIYSKIANEFIKLDQEQRTLDGIKQLTTNWNQPRLQQFTEVSVLQSHFYPRSPVLRQRASKALSAAVLGLTLSVILALGLTFFEARSGGAA